MKKKDKIVMLTVIVILLILSGSLMVANYLKTEKKFFDSYLIIGDNVGFDVNNTIIAFGMITPGGSSTRKIILENKYEEFVYVRAYASGSISEFVKPTEMVLYPLENKTLEITAAAEKNSVKGRYEGKITVVLRRALF